MQTAPLPHNESERLASLYRMQLLDTPAEEAFDRVLRLAQHIYQVPTVLLSILDEHRQWFKSSLGMEVQQTSREISFCSHAVYEGKTMVIADASKDERFADNPLVCTDTNIRFYAGRPLSNPEGYLVGTLCLIDQAPRTLSQGELALLNDLAAIIESLFSARGLSQVTQTLLTELDASKREDMLDPRLRIWTPEAILRIAEREAEHARRHHESLALLLADIDQLDRIRRFYGDRAAGALQAHVAGIMRQHMRTYHSLGRYDDATLLMVLPNSAAAEAQQLSERMRLAVERSSCKFEGEQLHCTLSMGLNTADHGRADVELPAQLESARFALQLARELGGNRLQIR